MPISERSSARSFIVTATGVDSPSSPATLSRNTASSPPRRRPTIRLEYLLSARSRSRLVLLDCQTEGTVAVGGLRRGAHGRRQGEGDALGHSRPDPGARLLLLCCADGGGTL